MHRALLNYVVLTVIALAIGAPSLSAGQRQFAVAAPPAWVEPVPFATLADLPSNQVNDGIYFLLIDEQEKVKEQTSFRRFVKKILSAKGVQSGAELSVNFDPSYEQLVLHTVRIWRDKRPLNRLEPAKIKILQRETDLDRKIYDGRLSAVIFLEDVRIGDTIEFAYSLKGANPIFKGRYTNSFEVRWSVPVAKLRQRLLWPTSRTLTIRNHLTTLQPRQKKSGSETEYLWETGQLPALIDDGDLPGWYDPYPWVQLSEYANWGEVVNWASDLYSVPAALSPPLQAKIAEIKKSYPSQEKQLVAALQFVQDEIRYLGIEFGANSHRPTPPGIVYQRRFGDCKDKSLLLCTILNQLGIKAQPALVNSANGKTVEESLPSPFAFNHVVVQAKLQNLTYWLDPTRSRQRGALNSIYFPSYGKALVISKETTALSQTAAAAAAEAKTEMRETFQVKDFTNPVKLQVTTRYSGLDADRIRARIAESTLDETEKNYLNYYAHTYPNIRPVKPLAIQDDEATNLIRTNEEYEISNFWSAPEQGKKRKSSFYAEAINTLIKKPATTIRTMPLGLKYPTHYRQTIEVILPEEWPVSKEDKVIADTACRFHYQRSVADNKLTLDYDYQQLADVVEVKEIPTHLQNLGQIQDKLGYELFYHPSATAGAKLVNLIGKVNWPLLVLAGLFLMTAVVVAVKVNQLSGNTAVELATPPAAPAAAIGGWLILVCIGLLLKPTISLGNLGESCRFFLASDWHALTVPDMESYYGLWAPTIIFELLANILLLVFSGLLLVLFFERKRRFPLLFIIFTLLNLAVFGVDYLANALIPVAKAHSASSPLWGFTNAAVYVMIWVPYFLFSKRVKTTFVR
jgi:transglutaminase-like putative cysteine protease